MRKNFLKKAAIGMCVITMLAAVTGCGAKSEPAAAESAPQEEAAAEESEATESEAAESEAAESTADAGEPKSIYIIAPETGNAWTRLKQGVDDACAEYGWEGTLTAPTKPYPYTGRT